MTLAWASGDSITAAHLNAMLPYYALKTTAQTVNNSAAVVDDTELQLTLPAGRIYRIETTIGVAGVLAADFQMVWSLGGTLTGVGNRTFRGSATTSASVTDTTIRNQMSAALNPSASATYGVGSTSALSLITETMWIDTGASGGLLKLQCAQAVATVGDTSWRGNIIAVPVS